MANGNVLVASDFLLSDMSYRAKLVYMILLGKAVKQVSTASLREMARLSGMSINTVCKAIRELVNAGVINRYPLEAGDQGIYKISSTKTKGGRSVSVPFCILHNRKIKPLQKVLYALLSAYKSFGKSNECYPGYRALAKALGVCKRTVQRAVDGLKAIKGIDKELIRPADRFPYLRYTFPALETFVRDEDVVVFKRSAYRTFRAHFMAEQEREESDKKKVCGGTGDSNTDKNRVNIKLSGSDYIMNGSYCQANSAHFYKTLSETELISEIQDQIDYECIVHDDPVSRGEVDACVHCLVHALQTAKHKGLVTIRGIKYAYPELCGKIRQIRQSHILLAMERYRDRSLDSIIHNPSAYMLSVLIGTLSDIDLHFTNLVRYDYANK